MLLAIDIGNTNLHVGYFEKDDLLTHFCVSTSPNRTADEYAWMLRSLSETRGVDISRIDGVILGSVVPSVTGILREVVTDLTDAPILTVGPGLKTGFPIRIDDPAELGADIAATVAATVQTVGYPAIVADVGTATVLSVVDQNGAYCGSSILPGIRMSLNALHSAELLPGISTDGRQIPVLGKSTADSMRSGVLRGQAMSIGGFAELYRETLQLPKDTPVILSGGAAEYLLPYLPAHVRHIPLLSLRGLQVIYRLNEKKKR